MAVSRSHEALTRSEEQELQRALLRASEQGWGIAIGLVAGLSLLLATVILVVRGGDPVGPHLQLLSVYFPGYRVTWLGSGVGFVYAFVVGYGVGRTIATVYNRLVEATR